MTIIDRRPQGRKASVTNRQRFLNKYKKYIRREVEDLARDTGITDVAKGRKIRLKKDGLDEPSFGHDLSKGKHDHVLPGNENLEKGDRILRPPPDNEQGPKGTDTGDGFDSFTFTLTKDEFIDIYFSDMELPDFIKESLKGNTKLKRQRAGYSKTGVPARLDLKKTLKQSLARRIATKSKRFLTDLDLRYKHYTKNPVPIRQAVIFLLMDVSGSMNEYLKELSKKFFLLLYLFLTKTYKQIQLRFIRHTQDADEVEEHEFFYGTKTGGTMVSSGLQLIKEIIDREIKLDETNIYLAQASDGDNFSRDNDETTGLVLELLQKLQYFAYVQVGKADGAGTLMEVYSQIQAPNLSSAFVNSDKDVYPALRALFHKEGVSP